MKYQIETTLGRKPKTDLDIIDECDEFLDNFANERRLNLTRLATALNNLMPKDQEKRTVNFFHLGNLSLLLGLENYEIIDSEIFSGIIPLAWGEVMTGI